MIFSTIAVSNDVSLVRDDELSWKKEVTDIEMWTIHNY
jgi:hypothetical protein